MPADERIRVIFDKVHVKDDADTFGSGEWYFIASVDGHSVGERDRDGGQYRIFDAREGRIIDLATAHWSHEVDVSSKASVEVRFQVMDQDVVSDDNLGAISDAGRLGYVLRPPWRQRRFTTESRYFLLEWRVELAVLGRFGWHSAGDVFACREVAGSVRYTTVSGGAGVSRGEIHQVRPVPAVGLPPRPAMPPAAVPVENVAATNVGPGDALNVIANPAVIPILTAAEAAEVGAEERAARMEFTYYCPDTLAIANDDQRLEWSVVSLSGGGNARFLGSDRGLRVLVYGTAAGQVRLEVRFQGALFATYRALVAQVRQIPFRVNILRGPSNHSRPRSNAAQIRDHIAIANRFLRQLALELVPDTNNSVTNNAHATDEDGIFQINVSAGVTRNVSGNYPTASRLNMRANVLNIAYIHSIAAPAGWTIWGQGTDIGENAAAVAGADGAPRISDDGIPTTSWYRAAGFGCGIPPDADPDPANPAQIEVFPRHQRNNPANLFALLITNGNGDPQADRLQYGKTVAHELGHVLTLRHRTGAGPDGLDYPPQQNIMCQSQPPMMAQDFDLIQAIAVRGSGLVPP